MNAGDDMGVGLVSGRNGGLSTQAPVVFASDFEDGTTQGWYGRGNETPAVSTAQAASGLYSLLTTGRIESRYGPGVSLLGMLQAGASYEIEARVRLIEGSGVAQLELMMQFVTESDDQRAWQQIAVEPAVTDAAWSTLRGVFTPPEHGYELELFIGSSHPTVSYYVDDITVTMVDAPPAVELPRHETGRVDFDGDLQHIDGFGFSQAFQRAAIINGKFGLTPENQRKVLDLLFDPTIGAGFNILRLGIGASPDDEFDHMKSIQPTDPGGPDAEPRYEWDGYDGGQVWLAKRAQEYGVTRFFACAWSAPGYMKTSGSENEGAELCGLPGTTCADDWRRAFADYLLQYVRFYADEGIPITDLGFVNEPDWSDAWATMRFDDAQMVDFIKVIGPMIQASGLNLNLVCSEAAGWERSIAYTEAIEADPEAARWVDIHSGHSYESRARGLLPTRAPVWMSEFSVPSGVWVEAWDDGPSCGLALANDIHHALTLANVSAYLHWYAASSGNQTAALIQVDGPDFYVSQRFWAMAAYSRFIRDGAFRVSAQTAGTLLKMSAYRNRDGSRVVQLINNRKSEVSLELALGGKPTSGCLTTYRTDAGHSLAKTDESSVTGPVWTVELPPRSLTTLVFTADAGVSPASTPTD
ncbi:carbohydrate binding domain-containing protein [Plantactinospora sp. CA-290183]|uniref:carbohydrate binding domain-containing protein n=1 Tax=Plantactinospora sp. CA-290183 TaxID=3240006 RepID=UPI003D93365A